MVQLLTTKPRNCQLVSWLGLVTEVGNREFTFGFRAKDRAGVVMGGGKNSFLYSSDKNNLLCH